MRRSSSQSNKGGQPNSKRLSLKGIKDSLSVMVSKLFSRSSALELKADLGLESPVPHLLSSNVAPTESEVVVIEQVIRTARSDLAVLEGLHPSTGRGHGSPSKLEKYHIALVEFKQAHKNLLSPTRRVPREILELIFSGVDDDNYHLFSLPPVSQVCRLWREVALATPYLWSHIELNRDRGRFLGMSLLNLKLLRSRGVPLNISFSIPDHFPASDPVFQRILENSKRWGTANVSVSSSMFPSLDVIRGDLPILRDLTLCIIHEFLPQPCTVFEIAPSLRHVRVSGVLDLVLPWNQLSGYEELSGGMIDIGPKIGLLETASSLSLHWSSRYDLPDELLWCRNLETLHVRFANSGFFVGLQLPKIKELKIERPQGDMTVHLRTMIKNTPSPCHLRRLTFHHKFDHPKLFSALLQLLPELEELDICMPPLDDLIKLNFSRQPNTTPLVPKLRKLTLLTGDTIYDYAGPIRDITLSRCDVLATFMEFHPEQVQPYITPVVFLRSFRLQFPNASARLRQLRLLEDCIKNVDVPDELFRWTFFLDEVLKCTSPVIEYQDDINEVFFKLLSRNDDVHCIYRTGIHLTLDHFVRGNCLPGPKDVKLDELRRRANEVLKHWARPMMLDAPKTRRWALGSNDSLVFVSRQAICPPTPFEIVYGPMSARCAGGRCHVKRKEPEKF